ncbi:MAG: hypothetical protein AAGH15_04140 [Myxococcota bacterium]
MLLVLAGCSGADEDMVVDPCTTLEQPCFIEGSCLPDDEGGFTCDACPLGTEGDGRTCDDVDGCADMPCFAGVACADVAAPGTGFTCGECPAGTEGDGLDCNDVDGCADMPCFAGVSCTDVPAPGTGFACGDCPPGYEGDGVSCTDVDACADMPCLAGTTCTDRPVPDLRFDCSLCEGDDCPILRALAGPDQELVNGTEATLVGSAVGFNGRFDCQWTNDVDESVGDECTLVRTVSEETVFTLTVTDASGLSASDRATVSVVDLIVDAGDDANVLGGESATLSGSWSGASCDDTSCIACEWRLSDETLVSSACDVSVAPEATTQYFLTVTDTTTGASNTDGATVFVVDRPAQLCGWNVVVLNAESFPSPANPDYRCDETGTARRQVRNADPSIVLSDLEVENVRIVGNISVETASDDDLIGFVWGWESPTQYYLLSWKQRNQNLGSPCGNALAGIAIKKIDGALGAPETLTLSESRGLNVTDYVQLCADTWATDRESEDLLRDDTIFLLSPADPGAFTGGWADFVTYRFEFFYTPTRTKIFVYEDDELTGSTENLVTTLDVTDSSYPAGAFAFFSNSQENVAFGDFRLASLDDYAADAGDDRTLPLGETTTLVGGAELGVPPLRCVWDDGSGPLASETCTLEVAPTVTTTYTLRVTDDFGRVSTDALTVTVP